MRMIRISLMLTAMCLFALNVSYAVEAVPEKSAAEAPSAEKQTNDIADVLANIGMDNYDTTRLHALIIAIDEYKEWPDLQCAGSDGRAVAKTLKEKFAFADVKMLENEQASREAILTALDSCVSLSNEESLIIYYAGHGWMDPETKTGYWIPAEARRDKKFDYVANSQIVEDYFKKYRVKHLLVMADSCFSGTLLRGMTESRDKEWKIPAGFSKPSRWVLTSGDLAPVADDSGGGHSPFAARVLQYLNHSDSPVFGVQDLYVYVRKNLQGEAIAQPMKTPEHMPGGEFIFLRSGRTVRSRNIQVSASDELRPVEMIGRGLSSGPDEHEYLVRPEGWFRSAVYSKYGDGRFESKEDGKVYDRKLNRKWWMMNRQKTYTWQDAVETCEEESGGTFRLPTVKELQTLLTKTRNKKEWARINTEFFFTHKQTVRFWTSDEGFSTSYCVDFLRGVAEKTDRNELNGIIAIDKTAEAEPGAAAPAVSQ